MTVTQNGFSLYAWRVVNAKSRDQLFKLLENQCCPPVSDSRHELLYSGRVRLKLKRAYANGTTHVQMIALELLAKLQVLVALPLQSQRIYFGIFVGSHSKRTTIVVAAKSKSTRKRSDDRPPVHLNSGANLSQKLLSSA